MTIDCPRCGEKVEYSPGAVQTCSYCKVSLRLPEVNQLPEELRNQWFRELAAVRAKEEKRRKKLEAEERRRKQTEQQVARERAIAARREEIQRQQNEMPLIHTDGPPSLRRPESPPHGKGIANRLVYVLDPKFERCITPQIIRVFWALSLVLALLGVLIYALGSFQVALPRSVPVPNSLPDEVVCRESVLTDLIDDKELEQMLAESRPEPSTESRDLPPARVDNKPSLDLAAIRDEYEELSLKQLRAEMKKLEKAHPLYRTEWVYRHTLLYPLWVAAAAVAAVLNLLIIRMACEFLCVVFNIATHLSELRQALPSAVRE